MIIGKILKEAIDRRASDVIISSGNYPTLKIDGKIVFCTDYGILEKAQVEADIVSILSEKQRNWFLERKELDFWIDLQGHSRFRVNAFVQRNGFGAVFRPIQSHIPDFESLWIPKQVLNFMTRKSGLILVTGWVGSGKSTTLASMLEYVNTHTQKHIITVEDPIEFIFEANKSLIEQREVGGHTHNYENGLKYALRQAPDIIMVGEMRDLETFRLALRAAETGNLVLSTLHTSGAARTVARVIDMFPSDEKEQIKAQLSESLIGVVWQDLVERTEWEGRVPACEVLVNTISTANMIRKGLTHQIDGAIETGSKEGMLTMKKSLENLYGTGKISSATYDKSLAFLRKLS